MPTFILNFRFNSIFNYLLINYFLFFILAVLVLHTNKVFVLFEYLHELCQNLTVSHYET